MCEKAMTFFDNFPKNPTLDSVLNIDSLLQFANNIVAFCGEYIDLIQAFHKTYREKLSTQLRVMLVEI